MGGKGGSAPPQVQPQTDDSSMQMMMAMMQMMGSMQAQQPQAPEPLPEPEPEKVEPVDWSSQTDDLRKSVLFDINKENEDKKSRTATLHAGEEEDDAVTTRSLLGE